MAQEINTEDIHDTISDYLSIAFHGSRESALEALENSTFALLEILTTAEKIENQEIRDTIIEIIYRHLDEIDTD